jgi:hypothetical protein
MEDNVVLEMSRSEALTTWEALSAARAFLVTLEQDAAAGDIGNVEELERVIGRLSEAIPGGPEARE